MKSRVTFFLSEIKLKAKQKMVVHVTTPSIKNQAEESLVLKCYYTRKKDKKLYLLLC